MVAHAFTQWSRMAVARTSPAWAESEDAAEVHGASGQQRAAPGGFGETFREIRHHQRQTPRRGLRFRAADPAADAAATVQIDGEMAAVCSRQGVFGGDQPAADHRRAADAGAEGEHHGIVEAARGPGELLAEERHAGVVLSGQPQAELGATPAGEVEREGIVVFAEGLQHAVRAGLHDAGQGHRAAGAVPEADAGRRGKFPDGGGELRQPGGQAVAGVELQGAGGQHAGVVDDGAGGVAAPEVEGNGVNVVHGVATESPEPGRWQGGRWANRGRT